MKKRAILYKYRSWKKEEDRKTLTQNEFYLASPRDFNDPFDCRISPNLSLLDSKEKIRTYIDKEKQQQQQGSTANPNPGGATNPNNPNQGSSGPTSGTSQQEPLPKGRPRIVYWSEI